MSTILRRTLSLRGVHWLATHFGGKKLSALSFDEKFRSGDWNFKSESPELVRLVEKHANHGHILVLGCGISSIASALAPSSYETFLGVDISTEAIALAKKQANERIRFEIGDMATHQCSGAYDVILFSDSLYYVRRSAQESLLQRLRQSLTPQGCIIVAIAHSKRYAWIYDMIHSRFVVQEDRTLEGSERRVITFR